MAITIDDWRNATFGEPTEATMQLAFDVFAEGVDVLRKPTHNWLTAPIEREANELDWAYDMMTSKHLAHIAIERDPEII